MDSDRNLAEENDSEVSFFREKLDEALAELEVLDDQNCDRSKARDAWDKVFDVTFFNEQPNPSNESASELAAPFVVTSNDTAKRSGGDRFG